MKRCICIKDYHVTAVEYISPLKHSNRVILTIFKKNEELYYVNKKDGLHFVAKLQKHLVTPDYYATDIEYMDDAKFNEHFVKI